MKKYIPFVTASIAAFLFATTVLAAEKSAAAGSAAIGGKSEALLVAEIALLMLVGRGLGEFMQRLGQPAVIGQLLAGLILGPSLFGWLWPSAHHFLFPGTPEQKSLLSGLSNMGVMMLLLLTGMETDLTLARKVGAPALAVTAAGIAAPFICGIFLGQFLPDSILPNAHGRLVASLFLGTALSISSIKIVAMVVREMDFTRRNLGQIIVASAIMEDTVGWIIISVTLGIAGSGIATAALAKTVIGTALFLGASYTVGRRLVFWLIRWVNDNFVSEYAVITAILVVMCIMALITQLIGVNTVLGAFVAGVLVGESPILSQKIEDELRGLITAFLMPIFFGMSGLSADLTVLTNPNLALLTFVLVAIASIGKFAGAFAGGQVSGLTRRESIALGCAMNARGSTEVIVATIGLTMGALSQNLYTMIVTMAVLTTIAMPPMLRWALKRLPMRKDEKIRLQKEEIDAKGFVSRFERLLVAADESANGKFATRIAGFIAGQRGMPITVLQVNEDNADVAPPLKDAASKGAEEGSRVASEKKGEVEKVYVQTRAERKVDASISREAHKGYDILFMGVGKMLNADGTFSADVDRAASQFGGPLMLTIAGEEGDIPSGLDILVPVNGTEASRRGAEMAFAISPADESKVTALLVADRSGNSGAKRPPRRANARNRIEKAVLEDVTLLAGRYGYDEIQTAVHIDIAPDVAIIEEAERCGADIIIIGAQRRVGERLYVGQTVTRVLKKWKGAAAIVVTQ